MTYEEYDMPDISIVMYKGHEYLVMHVIEGRTKEMSKGKMTLKEFRQILEDAEVSTDFESILNQLVGYHYRISDECATDGHASLAENYMRKGNSIYDALDQRGYYDEK